MKNKLLWNSVEKKLSIIYNSNINRREVLCTEISGMILSL